MSEVLKGNLTRNSIRQRWQHQSECSMQNYRVPCYWLKSKAKAAGGKHQRLREHRIGYFRFQACGGCDARGDAVLIGAFLDRCNSRLVGTSISVGRCNCVLRNTRRCRRRKADLARRR